MTGYFADTFYWNALINSRDQAHWPVIDFTRKLGPRAVITTDEVLGELLDYYGSHLQLRKTAGLTANNLLNDPDIRVVPQSRSSFQEGIALYNARPDKGYSLTDCISMVTTQPGRLDGGIDQRSLLRAGRLSRHFPFLMAQMALMGH